MRIKYIQTEMKILKNKFKIMVNHRNIIFDKYPR